MELLGREDEERIAPLKNCPGPISLRSTKPNEGCQKAAIGLQHPIRINLSAETLLVPVAQEG
jgi:hypothetical protein